MNQPNVIIIHGCPSEEESTLNPETRTYDKHWMPWIQQQLVERGIPTVRPLMPKPWAPNYEAYSAEFEKLSINEKSIFIGHSCGCAFLVRWLGETQTKIAKLILVAPWKIPSADNLATQTFYNFSIDESIKSRVGEVVIFTADDEEADGKTSVNLFHQALGGEIIGLKGHGHYTQGDMGTTEFSELLRVVLK